VRKGKVEMSDVPVSLWIGMLVVGIISGVVGGLGIVLVIERIWRGVEKRRVMRAWDEVDKVREQRKELERQEYEEGERQDEVRARARRYRNGLRRSSERVQERIKRVRRGKGSEGDEHWGGREGE
jgi:hypothetical protein